MRILGLVTLCAVVAALSLALVVGGRGDVLRLEYHPASAVPAASANVLSLEPGWQLEGVRTIPGEVNALLVGQKDDPKNLCGLLFVGTSGAGAIFRLNIASQGDPMVIVEGLGDANNLGQCYVNHLALHDLDADGTPELLGSTSQVSPKGLPRLGVWTLKAGVTAPRALARPEIMSNWSHSLGFLPRAGQGSDSAFITFCGYGEVVEYRMKGRQASDGGFLHDELDWKVVGQTPASGEWLQVADADNDGRPDVCIATGYALGKAAVLIEESAAPGAPLRLRHRIDEGGRFGNVRFQVVDFGQTGTQEIVAWWCTGLADGDAELIAYQLGPEGVRTRTVVAHAPASDLWADDGHFTTGDLDGDGRTEIWFASGGGLLWQYAPEGLSSKASSAALSLVARFHGSVGALAIGPDTFTTCHRLYLGCGKSILSLRPAHPKA